MVVVLVGVLVVVMEAALGVLGVVMGLNDGSELSGVWPVIESDMYHGVDPFGVEHAAEVMVDGSPTVCW